ncbi:hypothetical protein H238_0956 [Klebsiella pneumoniae UHKPC179]|nr:hypothetical protein H237_0980 [Klebsiella pneumoniae UHKPC57]EPO96739.1 hypothetical protein H238_0956 [Klebsiella pneumoniae UHKPC179]OWW13344.1 hypothetical protein BUE65_26775 [Klebsiella variicola]CDL13976.1 hypothetical protein [Klebsiella pneumoniae IS46]
MIMLHIARHADKIAFTVFCQRVTCLPKAMTPSQKVASPLLILLAPLFYHILRDLLLVADRRISSRFAPGAAAAA